MLSSASTLDSILVQPVDVQYDQCVSSASTLSHILHGIERQNNYNLASRTADTIIPGAYKGKERSTPV